MLDGDVAKFILAEPFSAHALSGSLLIKKVFSITTSQMLVVLARDYVKGVYLCSMQPKELLPGSDPNVFHFVF